MDGSTGRRPDGRVGGMEIRAAHGARGSAAGGAVHGPRGMTDAGRDVVGPLVLGAWDDFLPLVEQVDLDRATRLPGWRAREVAVHLGVWDDYDALAGLVASARKGLAGADPDVEAPDVDAANARVTAAHRHASRAEVLGALARHRGALERYLTREPPALPTAHAGPLPTRGGRPDAGGDPVQ